MRKKLLTILMSMLMVFVMMPITVGTVFADDETVYTVTVEPGDGIGDTFTVQSTTIISRSDMISGNYDQAKGCFYLDDDGKVYYHFPMQCSFTAPADKEFDKWADSFGGTKSGRTVFDIAETGDFTITALWKDQEAHSTADLTIPSNVNVQYGDTQTTFDIQVNSLALITKAGFKLVLNDSVFTNADNETIPFTVSCNGLNAERNDFQGWARIVIPLDSQPEYPYTCQGFINIRSEDLSNASPGSYSATLKYRWSSYDANGEGTIALSLTIPSGLPPVENNTVSLDDNVSANAPTTCSGTMEDQSFAYDEGDDSDDGGSSGGNKKGVDTGDENHLVGWLSMLALTAVALPVVIRRRYPHKR